MLLVPLLIACGGATLVQIEEPLDVRVVAHIPCVREPCAAEGEAAVPREVGRPRATMLALGRSHSCALTEDGGVYCWGAADRGQRADILAERDYDPQRVPDLPPMAAIWAGGDMTCARTIEDGTLYCWGDTGLGRAREPTFATALPFAGVHAALLGDRLGCFVDDHHVYCWGDFGAPYAPRWSSPQRVPVASISALSIGDRRVCGLDAHRRVVCWGREFGRWGRRMLDEPAWTMPDMPRVRSFALSHGSWNTIWLVGDDGHVYRTGVGESYGMDDWSHVRRDEVPNIADPTYLVAGSNHACALLGNGTAACWGGNLNGQLGDGTNADRVEARYLSLSAVEEIAVGEHHSCARADGRVYCWGQNGRGQAGVAGDRDVLEPTEIPW
jgi:alpha-tubulin suppressor-like RCC1 family protein